MADEDFDRELEEAARQAKGEDSAPPAPAEQAIRPAEAEKAPLEEKPKASDGEPEAQQEPEALREPKTQEASKATLEGPTVEPRREAPEAAPPPEPAVARPARAPSPAAGARAMSARKPGPMGRAAERVGGAIGGMRKPRFTFLTFLYLLCALIIFAFLVENWTPVRIDLFGVFIDIPKTVALIISLALGMAILKLWQEHRRNRGDEEGPRE